MRLFARLTNLVRGLASRWIGARERRNPGRRLRGRHPRARRAVREAARGGRRRALPARASSSASSRERSGELGARPPAARPRRRARRRSRRRSRCIARREHPRRRTSSGSPPTWASSPPRPRPPSGIWSRSRTRSSRLREERVRMLARLANAKARLRLHETLSGLSPEADIRALETVREHVEPAGRRGRAGPRGRRSRARAPARASSATPRPDVPRARSSKSSSGTGTRPSFR